MLHLFIVPCLLAMALANDIAETSLALAYAIFFAMLLGSGMAAPTPIVTPVAPDPTLMRPLLATNTPGLIALLRFVPAALAFAGIVARFLWRKRGLLRGAAVKLGRDIWTDEQFKLFLLAAYLS